MEFRWDSVLSWLLCGNVNSLKHVSVTNMLLGLQELQAVAVGTNYFKKLYTPDIPSLNDLVTVAANQPPTTMNSY